VLQALVQLRYGNLKEGLDLSLGLQYPEGRTEVGFVSQPGGDLIQIISSAGKSGHPCPAPSVNGAGTFPEMLAHLHQGFNHLRHLSTSGLRF
jgi:hypothetical protein